MQATALVSIAASSPAPLAAAGIVVAVTLVIVAAVLIRRRTMRPARGSASQPAVPSAEPGDLLAMLKEREQSLQATIAGLSGAPAAETTAAPLVERDDPEPVAEPVVETVSEPVAEGTDERLIGDDRDGTDSLTEPVPTATVVAPVEAPAGAEVVSPPAVGARYATLADRYAASGRLNHAMLAQWADDVRTLDGAVWDDADQLVGLLRATTGTTPTALLTESRDAALSLLNHPAAVTFRDLGYLSGPGTDGPGQVSIEDPSDLRKRAHQQMLDACSAGTIGQSAALARSADLLSLDAVLIASAARAGDTNLISVKLRRDLAEAALEDLDATLPGEPGDLHATILAVRGVLRSVVEPHEVDDLDAAFAPVPA